MRSPRPTHGCTSMTLVERDLNVLWHPCAQMRDYHDFPPLEIVGAQGCHLQLADGTSLIDAISSWWCKALGHRHPRLTAALHAQADRFEHVLLANTTNEPVVRFCERLLAVAGGDLRKVFLSGDGSTGIEVALKLAVQYQAQSGSPQRTRFAHLEHGYHGESIATMSVSDCALYRSPFAALCFPATVLTGLPWRYGPEDPQWQDASAEWPAIERQLAPVAGQLAGLIIEPVLQGAGGMRLYSPDLLRRLRAWCSAHGVLLIADEVATGCGRLGAWLGCHLAEVTPDIAVLSKGLSGGYLPLAATLTTQRIYETFDGSWDSGRAFLHSNTYSGNALAVAVGNAVLDVFHDEHILAHVASHGPRLRQGLTAMRSPNLRGIRGCGMMAAADLTQVDGRPWPRERRMGLRVFRAAIRHGALLRNLGDTVYLLPPLIANDAVIDELLDITGRAIAEACYDS